MKLLSIGLTLMIGIAPSAGCSQAHPDVAQRSSLPIAEIKVQEKQQQDDNLSYDFFIKADSLSYNGYKVFKLNKTVDAEYTKDIPITYAVLKKNNRIIATFDGVYFGLGNATDFGLAPLLGNGSQQLVVSQTVPRGGRHWIVDLSSDARVLFDSFDYDLGREEVAVTDIDKDGVMEIVLMLVRFWGFDSMSMAESPLPDIVFKYDPSARKYLPANPEFGYGLKGIEGKAEAVSPEERPSNGITGPYLAKRLDILLRYIYAGKRELGWAFFERTYDLPNKDEISKRIRSKLAKEPVYRFIYDKRSKK